MPFMKNGAPIGFSDHEDMYFAAHEFLMEIPSQQELSRAITERWSSFSAPRINEGDFDLAATAVVHGRMKQSTPDYTGWGIGRLKTRTKTQKRKSTKWYRGVGTIRAVLSQLEEE